MKKAIRISLGFLLIMGCLYYTLIYPLYGSVIRKAIVTSQVRRYVSAAYGEDYSVQPAVYNAKTNTYLCQVASQISKDTFFTVYAEKEGTLIDSYEQDVLQKGNTFSRLSQEMDRCILQEFLPRYPHRCVQFSCEFAQSLSGCDDTSLRDRLSLDMPLEMENPPLPIALALEVECDDPSWETLWEAVRDAKETAEDLDWQIAEYSLTLHITATDQKPIDTATEYSVSHIPCKEIGS